MRSMEVVGFDLLIFKRATCSHSILLSEVTLPSRMSGLSGGIRALFGQIVDRSQA
jgi:hypothetical protein